VIKVVKQRADKRPTLLRWLSCLGKREGGRDTSHTFYHDSNFRFSKCPDCKKREEEGRIFRRQERQRRQAEHELLSAHSRTLPVEIELPERVILGRGLTPTLMYPQPRKGNVNFDSWLDVEGSPVPWMASHPHKRQEEDEEEGDLARYVGSDSSGTKSWRRQPRHESRPPGRRSPERPIIPSLRFGTPFDFSRFSFASLALGPTGREREERDLRVPILNSDHRWGR
jgi:hypothetical protein